MRTGLGHCLSQLSQTISLRMATSSIDVKLERFGLDWDHLTSLMLPSWLSGDGPCTAPLRPRVGASPSGTATACFATAAGAPPVRSPVLQPVATAGPVRSADDEPDAFTWSGSGSGSGLGRGGGWRRGEEVRARVKSQSQVRGEREGEG